MAFSYWQTGNFGCGFRAPANQGDQGSIRNSGRQGYGYANYAPGSFGRDGWNKWTWSGSCLKTVSFPAASNLTDDFDDNSQDTEKWTTGNFHDGTAAVTGTIAETNQRVEVTPSTSSSGQNGYISVNSYDLTGDAVYVRITPSGTMPSGQQFWLTVGIDGNNTYQLFWDAGDIFFFKNVAGTFTSYGSFTWATFGSPNWFRIRHGGPSDDTLYIDTASGSSANPPASGDWTNRLSHARDGIAVNSLKSGFGTGSYAGAASTVPVYFDGFNTASSAASAAVGQSNETDTALGRGWGFGAGLAADTDTALALSGKVIAAIGLATETDSSLALAAKQVRLVGFSSETDAGLALVGKAILAAGLASETDSAQTLAGKIIRALGLSAETDSALASGRAVVTGLASETDTALARSGVSLLAAGRSDETDTALQLLQGGAALPVGTATETNTARALGIASGFVASVETDIAISRGAGFSVSPSIESDSSLSLSLAVLRGVGLATETDSSQALGKSVAKQAGAANENDAAIPVGVAFPAGLSVSTNEALPLLYATPAPLPANRITHASAIDSNTEAAGISDSRSSPPQRTTYAPRKAAA
jgi:hypothetical protein